MNILHSKHCTQLTINKIMYTIYINKLQGVNAYDSFLTSAQNFVTKVTQKMPTYFNSLTVQDVFTLCLWRVEVCKPPAHPKC